MSERVVRTVRGDIAPGQLGACDAHEHLFLVTLLQPGDEFADVEQAVVEATSLRSAGAEALVDWTPIGLGRDLDGLRTVSEATGLNVVAATGLHREAHYAADDSVRREDAQTRAARFAAEIVEGEIRCGIVKVGASYHALTPFERTTFEAAAEAHARTGAPIGVHTEHGTMGLALVELLGSLGVPADAVILAHLDRNPDVGEHDETASAGPWLQLDGPGRTKYWPDSTILTLIEALAERGHSDRLLLGGDTGRRSRCVRTEAARGSITCSVASSHASSVSSDMSSRSRSSLRTRPGRSRSSLGAELHRVARSRRAASTMLASLRRAAQRPSATGRSRARPRAAPAGA